MYVCICNAVTERQIHATVAEGATSLADLQFELGVATCCGCCAETAQEYLPGGASCAMQPACPGLCEQPHPHPHHVHAVAHPGGAAANVFPLVRVKQAA